MANWLKWLEAAKPYVEAGGEIAGGIAANRAKGRVAENAATATADRDAINRYIAEEQAKREALRLQEDATKDRADRYLESGRTRAGQAAFGDILSNIQDVQMDLPDWIPDFNLQGGLRPSALGANARAAGQTLSRDALQAMLSGADVPDLPNVGGIGRNAPEATPMAEATGLDRALELGGYAGQAAGTIREVQEQRRKARAEQEAAQRTPLPAVRELGYLPPVGYQPPAPPAPGDYRVNTLQLLAEMKAAEDAANAGRRGK
jgi:hypothetical protein